MKPIVFTVPGVQSLLENLEVVKSLSSDKIHHLILKHRTSELAPILQVIFSVTEHWKYPLISNNNTSI